VTDARSAGCAALVLGVILGGCAGDDTANGSGVILDGTFFHESSGEVRPESLGRVLRSHIPVRDTRADVREIHGVAADEAVAVESDPGGPAELGWYLFAADEEVAANPWADTTVAGVLLAAD
jgi:hypothetical protein